jgi:transcriptional regulator with XRE-family HTH domain
MHSFVNHLSASYACIDKGASLLNFSEMPNFKARLGDQIAHLRDRAGLSQRDVANSFEPPIASSTVARIESGISWPEYAKLERFAELFKCSVDDFFAGPAPHLAAAEPTGNPGKSPLAVVPVSTAHEALLGKIVLALSRVKDEEKLRGFLGQLEFLLNVPGESEDLNGESCESVHFKAKKP